jgi:multidrug efflux pump
MHLSRFFIDRPIFAGVISVAIFLAGLISMTQLPISEYPEVVPPSVVVTALFPGANPETVADTVATPLEEQINGTENMLYMFSQAASDGTLTLTVTFKLGTDPNLAQQLVQNRVNQALPRLPDVTRNLGVTTVKSSPDLTMVVHLKSVGDRYDMLYLRNYAVLNVKDQLAKIEGIGSVQLFGSGDYAMRIWLNPQKIAELGLSADDVVNAVRRQNVQVAAGLVNGPPYSDKGELQLPINVEGRLSEPEQFGQIVVKNQNGVVTRLSDVARVEIDAAAYSLRSLLDNQQAVAIPIFQAPGSNAIQISNRVRATMEQLKKNFPEGMDYSIVYDPTVFVRDSIKAVVHTLLEAIALVVLVVILFLQTWRASIIPLLAVPTSIVGTFAGMWMCGFSINALSLFGLVLAIGIVVDDAIVVVENVERNIEAGLTPRDATLKAMSEVTGPIIAIALVLSAVFVPIAFISGLTGEFYRQFALTIACSTIISAFNSLTLSPAMSALLLKGEHAPKDFLARGMERALGPFFMRFNRVFHAGSSAYSSGVGRILSRKTAALGIYAVLLAGTFFVFRTVPPGFVPLQDKQYLVSFAQLPEGATLARTEKVIREMSDIALKEPGVESAVAFPGLSINGFINSPSAGIVFETLKPFEERTTPDLSGFAISQKLQAKFAGIRDAVIAIFPPPPVNGLGTIAGFKLQVEDRTDQGDQVLNQVMADIQTKARKTPELMAVFSNFNIGVPQLYAHVDRIKAMQLGVEVQDIFDTMQTYLGSIYVNDFNRFGRTYEVIAQADIPFRSRPDDILRLQVRNSSGNMVPLGAVVDVSQTTGPDSALRYNGFRSADLNGAPAPGYSSGQAQAAITQILAEALPKGMQFEWTDLTYQEILAGNTALLVFPICVLLVFLVLAAQYESLMLPLAIILIVPMCLFSAITGVWLTGGDNNVFTQIGLFVLIGLACKNAILIVEFARELELRGRLTVSAAIEAAGMRLRPILMTSFAFIMGVIPLVLSSGAGSEMRHAMGVAVFFGMLGVTFFGLFLTPVFYVLLRSLTGMRPLKGHGQSPMLDKTVPSYNSDTESTVTPSAAADKARELAG